MLSKESIALELFNIGAVKFGEFKIKSGMISPYYLDIKCITSKPKLLRDIAETMWESIPNKNWELVCGVPYTALPIATVMSVDHEVPMVIRRKEAKGYGTNKIIDGIYQPGQSVLVVEDVITSGASIMETIAPLEEVGLKPQEIVILINREQGGKARLESAGYKVNQVMSVFELLEILENNEKITTETGQMVRTFITENQVG